jgi:hypothetical protein
MECCRIGLWVGVRAHVRGDEIVFGRFPNNTPKTEQLKLNKKKGRKGGKESGARVDVLARTVEPSERGKA